MELPPANPADELLTALDAWGAASPRFAAFVATNQAKIRKKARNADDNGMRADLLFELMVAHKLLGDQRIALRYEPLGQGKQRGPDFAATFKGHLGFAVEATRLRSTPRFGDAVTSKLGQLLPQQSNIVVLGSDELLSAPDTVVLAMQQLRLRAERRDAALFERSGLRDPAEFFKYFGRLSALAVLATGANNAPAILWSNPQARHPLPNELRNALERCL